MIVSPPATILQQALNFIIQYWSEEVIARFAAQEHTARRLSGRSAKLPVPILTTVVFEFGI